jgi:hypothetical protein
MSRVLEREHGHLDLAEEEASTGRTTARALATAIALLIVSILVVTRSRAALERTDAHADASLAAGNVQLTDDDAGSSLFAVDNMVPGRPASDCIVVSYHGNVLPVQVGLSSQATGDLASLLAVQVERGTGGTFHDCTGFKPTGVVFHGTLAGLASQRAGVAAFRVDDVPAAETFKFTFTMTGEPRAPQGADGDPHPTVPSASARFLWTADPLDAG